MIELVLSICLLDDARKCRDESLTFTDVTLLTCAVGGQAQVASYMELRPRWFVNRWSCQQAGKVAKI